MKAYTEILRGLREDHDMKQVDVANLLGTTQQQYSKYETGESELPLRALPILADRYGVSSDFILGRTDCREGITGLNQQLLDGSTVGALISDVLSLGGAGRRAVVEYVALQKLKETNEKR